MPGATAGAPRLRRRAKMRTLAWCKLPASRVAKQRNVWTVRGSRPTELAGAAGLDFDEMERLFTVPTSSAGATSSNNSAPPPPPAAAAAAASERKKTADEVPRVLLAVMYATGVRYL